jgi:hypothetical protein
VKISEMVDNQNPVRSLQSLLQHPLWLSVVMKKIRSRSNPKAHSFQRMKSVNILLSLIFLTYPNSRNFQRMKSVSILLSSVLSDDIMLSEGSSPSDSKIIS